jgi:hypothetical protein
MILPEFRKDVCLVKHQRLPAITIVHVMLANKVESKIRDFKNLTFIFPLSESLYEEVRSPNSGFTSRVGCFTIIGDEVMTSRFAWQLINPFAESNSSFNT